MKRSLYLLIILNLIIFIYPCFVNATAESTGEVVAKTVKYYKTETTIGNSNILAFNTNSTTSSTTTEITEEEYNNADAQDYQSNDSDILPLTYGTSETTYKKMTTTISKNGDYYLYDTTLNWKNMPSTRSYDIISLGYFTSVTPVGVVRFYQRYVYSDGVTRDDDHTPYRFTNAIAAIFKLPSSKITSLEQELYFNVRKTNSSATIVRQNATGDYAHAKKSISAPTDDNFLASNEGLSLNTEIYTSYDTFPYARATWTGTW